ncbi:MAG TPA: endolytic transglycosylase MltG [Bacteroidales bacterium]|nr:endolytic transglycosylase MltG [Bacteroidales bacterium]
MKKIFFYKVIGLLLLALVAGISVFSVNIYNRIYEPNVMVADSTVKYLYIPTGSDFEDVKRIIVENNILENSSSFVWLAEKKNYPSHVYPGRYALKHEMSNNEIINLLRSGFQEPVKVVFNNIRTKKQLAGRIAKQIEADSLALLKAFTNDSIIKDYDFKPETFTCIFIPNTYEFWWNTTATSFVQRMYKEYQRFWTKNRLTKAKALNLTPEEVITLASIVDEETLFNDEMQKVAGVYVNRLRKRMHLQADPTLKYALGDFSIKRVLTVHKQIDSPYNTYKHYGLPPGPISIPSIAAIDAVLNYEQHNFLYFCARPDFSGYHNFAQTLTQHNINARKYQRALDKERIWR